VGRRLFGSPQNQGSRTLLLVGGKPQRQTDRKAEALDRGDDRADRALQNDLDERPESDLFAMQAIMCFGDGGKDVVNRMRDREAA
jgi:hypothetical protein